VIVCVTVDLLAVSSHHVEADDVFACQAVDAAVPAIPALQQIAADTDAFAVPGGKE
jgi:hypothetical protein